MKTFILKPVGLSLLLLSGFSALGDSLYDSTNYNGHVFTMGNNQEIGNEVFLSSPGFSLTNFNFEYNNTNGFPSGNVGVDVRFYLNDGDTTNGFATPGSLFYESGWFSPITSGNHDIIYDSSDLYGGSLLNLTAGFSMPTNFTFTVTFSNVLGGNDVEIPLADPPSGQYGDYWLNTAGGWELQTNAVPTSFIAGFSGTPTPEPSVFSLGVIGGALLMWGMARQRKHRRQMQMVNEMCGADRQRKHRRDVKAE